jgi:glycosyltransferase involved in cell wall biosynthesis
MHKLIIQIPCFNEEASLPITLAELPRSLPGIDVIEWLVIDDGSTDRTVAVARENGVDHVLRMRRNSGLATAFMMGLDFCVRNGADIIVNTDADNQYHAGDIPTLIAPILEGRAEIVIGERPIADIEHFSLLKKLLQRVGSWVVRVASGAHVADAPSGFRAIERNAAMRLNVFNNHTYTLETIIQAGRKNMAMISVPVRTNPYLRPSRLISSIPGYIFRSVSTIFRIFMTYRPFRFFALPGVIFLILGILPSARFLYFYSIGYGMGNIQSLMFGVLFLGIGAMLIIVGLLADLIGVNRMLLEDIRFRLRRMDLDAHLREAARLDTAETEQPHTNEEADAGRGGRV